MSKYRIVQVAPIIQSKCFRVDQAVGNDVLGQPNYQTMKDDEGWAFFNDFDEAQQFIDSFKKEPVIVYTFPRIILEVEI